MRTLLMLLLISTSFLACDSDNLVNSDSPKSYWLRLTMIQCLGNPWEGYWLGQPGNEYDDYPTEIEEQVEIAREYYLLQGIEFFDIKMCFTGVCPCLACSCCEGHSLYLRVSEGYKDTLIELGYQVDPLPRSCRDSIF